MPLVTPGFLALRKAVGAGIGPGAAQAGGVRRGLSPRHGRAPGIKSDDKGRIFLIRPDRVTTPVSGFLYVARFHVQLQISGMSSPRSET